MFRHKFQSGLFSILYSIGSKPLQIWDKKVRNGHIKRITDNDIQSLVLEMEGTNVSTTYITCPADSTKTLGIKLPIIILVVKNLKKYFTFEIKILDDENMQRRFRASNYRSTTSVNPFICTMPMRLDDGWNQIQFNLADLTRRAYGTNYIETLRVQIHANCRIRRVYFSDRLFSEDELPAEFKLYLPVQNKAKVSAQPQDISMEPGVSVSLGPEQSKETEPEPGTVKDPEPGMSTEPEAGTSTEPEQGTSTEPEQGTSTEPEASLEPVTSTELEPVTSTEPDIKVEPGTNTEGELGTSTELEPSKE